MSLLLLWTTLLLPQIGLGQGSADVSARFAADSVPSGQVMDLHVQFDITPGWHIYHPDQDENGVPTSVTVAGDGVEAAGPLQSLQEPKVHEVAVGSFQATYLWLEGKPELVLPVRVTGPVGTAKVVVQTHFMICDENVCLPAEDRSFEIPIQITEALAPTAAEVAVAAQAQEQEDFQNGQSFDPEREDVNYGKVSVDFDLEGRVAPGETVDLVFSMEVAPGWHVYDPKQNPLDGIPVSVVVQGDGLHLLSKATTKSLPQEHVTHYGGGTQRYWWQSGKLEWRSQLRFDGPIPDDAAVRLIWQACNEDSCLQVEQKTFSLATYADLGASGLPQGFWAFLLAAISAGLFTLLTPCVFPMIPVTISYFIKRAESGKGTPLGNATAYAGGIIFTFAGIGVGAALLLGAGGANAIGSNPWINLAIGLLFVVMAISLLGFFEIQAPRFLQNFASKTQAEGQTKGGYLPVALMAIAFSITAFTCTVGFVGAVFALGLKLGVLYLVGGMFVYGFVFALPFFFLALLPSRLNKLPSAGGWMNTVKVCAGFVELLAAIKFFSNTDLVLELEVLTWPVVLGLSTVILLLWGAYMLGLYKLPYDYEKPKPGKRRRVFALVILATGFWLAPGIFNRDYSIGGLVAYMPPKHYGLHQVDRASGLEVGPAELTWYEDYELAFAAALKAKTPLFLDFTGASCVNCRLMENGVFPDAAVKPLLAQTTRVSLWVDKRKEYMEMEKVRFHQVTQPLYVLIDPRTDTVLGVYQGYNPDPAPFAEFLQKGLDAYSAAE